MGDWIRHADRLTLSIDDLSFAMEFVTAGKIRNGQRLSGRGYSVQVEKLC